MVFDEFDLDLLKEISNIGAGNAAGSLSALVGQEIDISVPNCSKVGFSQIADVLGGPENVLMGILVQLSGDFDGFILMMQELGDAAKTLKLLMNLEETPGPDLSLDELEPMKEVCNILVGAYVSALTSMTGLKIMPSVPSMTVDMAMAIMNVPALVYGEVGEFVLVLDTKFGGKAEDIQGHFLLIPTLESFEILKKALMG
jgi:chemotaxis protein CheC